MINKYDSLLELIVNSGVVSLINKGDVFNETDISAK